MRSIEANKRPSYGAKSALLLVLFAFFVSGFFVAEATDAQAQAFNNYEFHTNTRRPRYYKPKPKRRVRKTIRRAVRTDTTGSVKKPRKPSFSVAPENKDPVHVVVSLPSQKAKIFKGTELVATTRVSTGKRGYSTPSGVFSIIQKNRRHFSNLYNNAPMPYMQRITWSGFALHAGYVPRRPASHGCIRLPHSFARKLFSFTGMGEHVVISRGEEVAEPTLIDHPALIHPRPAQHTSGQTAEFTEQTEHNLITTSAVIKTAALVTSDAHHGGAEIPSHIMRLEGRQKIKAVQRLLNYLGYSVGRPDGDLGPTTRRQIRSFQKKYGLKSTGLITPEFFATIYLSAGREDVALGRNPKNPDHAKSLKKPLRILITRRSETEKIRDAQKILRFLGYFKDFPDGRPGPVTRRAIKKFQYDFVLKETGELTDDLLERLYAHANWDRPSAGHLYVRQDFKDIFDAPVDISDPKSRLGTHIFTTKDFAPDATQSQWFAQTLYSPGKKERKRWNRRKRRYDILAPAIPAAKVSAREALDRITIPIETREHLAELLTPGSSMIIAEGGWQRETGEGTDFIVLNN